MFLNKKLYAAVSLCIWLLLTMSSFAEDVNTASIPFTQEELDELQSTIDLAIEPSKLDLSPFESRLKATLVESIANEERRWQIRYLLATHYFNSNQCYQVEALFPEKYGNQSQDNQIFYLKYFIVRAECMAKSEGPELAAKLHIKLAEKLIALGYSQHAIDPLGRAGVYKYRQAKYAEALALQERALEHAKTNNNLAMQAKVLLNKGASFAAVEKNEQAIRALMEGLDLSRQLNIPKFEAFANTTIGAIYMYSKEPDKAKPFYLGALELNVSIDNLYGQFICYVNLSIIEQSLENFDKASFYGQKSLELARELKDDNHIGNALIRLGSLEISLQRYEKAKYHFEEALKIYLALNNVDRLGYTYVKYVDLKLEQKLFQRALELSDLAEEYVDKSETPQVRLGFYSQRIAIFEHFKNYEEAYRTLVKKTEYEKEIQSKRRNREFEEVLQKYAAIEREKELSDLKNEKLLSDLQVEQGLKMRSMLIVGLAVATLASLLLLKLYSDSKLKSQSIEEQRVALEEAHERLEQIAMTDELTRIMNRRPIMNTLRLEWERAQRLDCPLSVILFDIDHFKSFNDTWGHDGGDFVLQQLARKVELLKRKHEYFARWGGEEFILVLPQQNIHQAKEAAERIRTHIENWRCEYADNDMGNDENKILAVTITLGCADNSDPNISLNGMIKSADLALYKGKENGRNQVQIHQTSQELSQT